ncbi:HYC_CC_PP family protein [Kaistella palustris]|uniref:HYC_CC_PP family protein n=1 Tax=Kaistella palustris TaxID=493376 RepID=UPI000422D194|nr:hypothetical protein [Kaistella palustris]
MKNIFVILLTVFYSATSSGMVWQLHQCFDEVFVSVGAEDGACGICGTQSKKDCCKSELTLVKTDLSQIASHFVFKTIDQPAILAPEFVYTFAENVRESNSHFIHINAPPDLYRPALFVIHCNYRI